MLDANLGPIGVWLAFLACLAGVVVIAVGFVPADGIAGTHGDLGHDGERELWPIRPATDGRMIAPVLLIGAVVATGAMEHGLVTHDFTLVFVAQNNSTVTPTPYSITGLWSALAGSILLWGLVLAIVSSVFVWRYRKANDDSVIR